MKKKNIAIIITKLNGGGAERCASNLSIELSKKYNVILVVFNASNMTYPYGGELIDLRIGSSNGILNKVSNVFKRVKRLKAIKKKYKVDCAVSLLDGPNLVNVLSSCGEKTIVSVRNMLSHEHMSKLRKYLIRYVSMHSDLTVSLSEMVKLDLMNNFGIPELKVKTIYNHCDAQLLRELCMNNPIPFNIIPNKANFVTMGRLNNQKGQWHLIRAFQKVVKEIPDSHLYILGVGELEASLRQLISDLKLDDYITMTGYIKNPHGIYSYCEAFVFPSLFEGLGNVLLEALAFDMPVISCDCEAGPREILAPNTDLHSKAHSIELAEYGVLVPVCDGEHFNATESLTDEEAYLADAMIYLHKHPDIREEYRKKAKERIRNFDKSLILDEWVNVIERD